MITMFCVYNTFVLKLRDNLMHSEQVRQPDVLQALVPNDMAFQQSLESLAAQNMPFRVTRAGAAPQTLDTIPPQPMTLPAQISSLPTGGVPLRIYLSSDNDVSRFQSAAVEELAPDTLLDNAESPFTLSGEHTDAFLYSSADGAALEIDFQRSAGQTEDFAEHMSASLISDGPLTLQHGGETIEVPKGFPITLRGGKGVGMMPVANDHSVNFIDADRAFISVDAFIGKTQDQRVEHYNGLGKYEKQIFHQTVPSNIRKVLDTGDQEKYASYIRALSDVGLISAVTRVQIG